MTPKLFTFLFLFVVSTSFGQESKMSIVSDVKKGEIRIKWFPANYDELQRVFSFGYTLVRTEINDNLQPEMANFSDGRTVTFQSKKSKLQVKTLEDTLSAENRAVLDPLLSKKGISSQNGKDFAFALFSLQNVLSADLAELVGLTYTDINFDANKTYAYRISIKGLNPIYIKIKASELTVYPQIQASLKLDKKKTIDVEWNAKKYTQFGFGYTLEKSLDNPTAGNFITELPIAPLKTDTEKEGRLDSYRDEKLTPGKYHFYRLTGLNYFGEPAFYSPWEKIYVPFFVNAEVYIDTIYSQDLSRVIEGTAISIGQKDLHIDKFLLEKSLSRDNGFEPVEEIQFTDSTFRFVVPMLKTGDQFYYRVSAISSDKDSVSSTADYFFTLDQEPPGPATMKSGIVDSTGTVQLLWTPPSDTDLKGFRIFRANAMDEEFQEVNKELSPASAYIDKIRLDNLTSEVYYFVRSVDKNYNNSINSDTLLLLKPDTIPPVVPYLYKPMIQDTCIALNWAKSSSTDIGENCLVRISEQQSDTIYRWSDSTEIFKDGSLQPGRYYSYQIISKDRSKNSSLGELRRVYFEPGYRLPTEIIELKANREKKQIEIYWRAPSEKVFSYQIYKADKNGKFTLIKTMEYPSKLTYVDRTISIGNQYSYYVKFITSKGIHSLPSQKKSVVY